MLLGVCTATAAGQLWRNGGERDQQRWVSFPVASVGQSRGTAAGPRGWERTLEDGEALPGRWKKTGVGVVAFPWEVFFRASVGLSRVLPGSCCSGVCVFAC